MKLTNNKLRVEKKEKYENFNHYFHYNVYYGDDYVFRFSPTMLRDLSLINVDVKEELKAAIKYVLSRYEITDKEIEELVDYLLNQNT